ncbi:hypothetical protein [Persicitalea jodogahamensis]|uniref:Uncharacterized protein n=1 Tax=Persicitalea jodogahamensis TaxID=402147 RepID=A0A8J3DBZ3_9BACT|nr:hypothetical protein [Persicitalea jodogahamensis]GHB87290.1 hypothetical protein GCM10007390_48870 [Persicitalea jodogahamensis]
MSQIYYFKRHQEGDAWHYYKLMDDRMPIAYEMLNFPNETPIIETVELDLDFLDCKTQYNAPWEVGIQITAEEVPAGLEESNAGRFRSVSARKAGKGTGLGRLPAGRSLPGSLRSVLRT